MKSMMESGSKASNKALAFGKVHMATHTSVSGAQVKWMATVCISGRMATGMKENGTKVSNMGKALTSLLMVTHIQVTMLMANRMALATTNGRTVQITWATSPMEWRMGLASGRKTEGPIATNTMATFSMTWNTGWEFSSGSQETYMRVATGWTCVRDLARWNGTMEVTTKVSGQKVSKVELED